MDLSDDQALNELLERACQGASELEPWHGYFRTKFGELKTISNFYNFDNIDSILEIGCGNGFTSCLLSRKAKRVEALDLPLKDPVSHSLGIESARDLVKRLDVKNVSVVGATAESLPFEAGSFDLVFSQFALQYVKDKNRAMSEMRRVLKTNGIIIAVVPDFMERILAPVVKYEYLLKKAIFYMLGLRHKNTGNGRVRASPVSKGRSISSWQKTLDDFLFLRPDGAYRSFMEELLKHTPYFWKKAFEKNGFKIVNTFSAQLIPAGLFDLMGAAASRIISERLAVLNKAIGQLPVIRSMGCSIGLIGVKV